MISKYNIHNGAKYFYLGVLQNYSVFKPVEKYIKYFSDTTQIYSWKSNGKSEESIENITKSDSFFAPTFVDNYILPDVNLNGHCLINNNVSITKKVRILCISYILNPCSGELKTDFTLSNCFFGSVNAPKNVGLDKCK